MFNARVTNFFNACVSNHAKLLQTSPPAPQTECGYIRGVIRLQGGRNGREGRVEVCNNGFWGSVCDGGWDNRDATVACRELGLLTADAGNCYAGGHIPAGCIPILPCISDYGLRECS